MIKHYTTKFCIFLSIIIINGCDVPLKTLNVEDVEGVWISEHESGIEVLEIKEDGTYILTFTRKDGKIFVNRNIWTIDVIGKNNSLISFKNFSWGKLWDKSRNIIYGNCPIESAPCKGNSYWPVYVERTFFGDLILDSDPDVGYKYVKQK